MHHRKSGQFQRCHDDRKPITTGDRFSLHPHQPVLQRGPGKLPRRHYQRGIVAPIPVEVERGHNGNQQCGVYCDTGKRRYDFLQTYFECPVLHRKQNRDFRRYHSDRQPGNHPGSFHCSIHKPVLPREPGDFYRHPHQRRDPSGLPMACELHPRWVQQYFLHLYTGGR